MSKDREERFSNGADLASALERAGAKSERPRLPPTREQPVFDATVPQAATIAQAETPFATPSVRPVRPADALPAGVYTLEVTVGGNRRLQQSVVLRAGERQQERFVVP